MGGKEEEYCLGKLETMPDNENDSPFPEGSHIGSLRDFWRASSGISNQNDRLLQGVFAEISDKFCNNICK